METYVESSPVEVRMASCSQATVHQIRTRTIFSDKKQNSNKPKFELFFFKEMSRRTIRGSFPFLSSRSTLNYSSASFFLLIFYFISVFFKKVKVNILVMMNINCAAKGRKDSDVGIFHRRIEKNDFVLKLFCGVVFFVFFAQK
jgi:hypothetical protein